MNDFWGLWPVDDVAQPDRRKEGESDRDQTGVPRPVHGGGKMPGPQMPTGHREAQALQARFGNDAVAQMVGSAVRTRAGRAAEDPVPAPAGADHAPEAADVKPTPKAVPQPQTGGAPTPMPVTRQATPEPVALPAVVAPAVSLPEPPVAPLQHEPEPDPVIAQEPVAAPKAPAPHAGKSVSEVDDGTRAHLLARFVAALAANPATASWAELAGHFDAAPRRVLEQAARTIAETVETLSPRDRKQVQERLGAAARAGRAAKLIELITARLATKIPAPPPPPPPPVPDPT